MLARTAAFWRGGREKAQIELLHMRIYNCARYNWARSLSQSLDHHRASPLADLI